MSREVWINYDRPRPAVGSGLQMMLRTWPGKPCAACGATFDRTAHNQHFCPKCNANGEADRIRKARKARGTARRLAR